MKHILFVRLKTNCQEYICLRVTFVFADKISNVYAIIKILTKNEECQL